MWKVVSVTYHTSGSCSWGHSFSREKDTWSQQSHARTHAHTHTHAHAQTCIYQFKRRCSLWQVKGFTLSNSRERKGHECWPRRSGGARCNRQKVNPDNSYSLMGDLHKQLYAHPPPLIDLHPSTCHPGGWSHVGDIWRSNSWRSKIILSLLSTHLAISLTVTRGKLRHKISGWSFVPGCCHGWRRHV